MRHPSLTEYTSARDFFVAVRNASREAERTRLTLMQMEAREDVRAQGYESHGKSGHREDDKAQTDARIDYESVMNVRVSECYELIDLAVTVVYGYSRDGKAGVSALISPRAADCVSFRYVDARPWKEVALLSRISERTCQELCASALDAVDTVGLVSAPFETRPVGEV